MGAGFWLDVVEASRKARFGPSAPIRACAIQFAAPLDPAAMLDDAAGFTVASTLGVESLELA